MQFCFYLICKTISCIFLFIFALRTRVLYICIIQIAHHSVNPVLSLQITKFSFPFLCIFEQESAILKKINYVYEGILRLR